MGAASITMNEGAPARPAVNPPAVNPWIIAIAVTLATFMEVLDTSIANVALPHIAGSLSAGQDESTWVLTSYLVSNAIVLPRGLTCAKPVGSTLATRHTFIGKAVLICSCKTLGIVANLTPSLMGLSVHY